MCEVKVKTSAEIHFAQKLASNEKKIRDRSLKRLRRWLVVKSSAKPNAFSSQDMMKLWKGLFYCMWMSDKPIIQENLASVISKLINCFSRKEYSFMFIDCFFQTMSREWFGLDKFRLEKFMMLVRRFLRESFEFLRKHKWMTEDIENLFQIMGRNVLNPQNDSTYLSLKLHVISIFMDELAQVDREELTSDKMISVLLPFCTILASTESFVLLFDTSKNIFQCLIHQQAKLLSEGASSVNASSNNKMSLKDDQDLPIFNVNCKELKTLIFDLAKQESVKKMNRNVMYGLVRKFKDLSEGINPFHRQLLEADENKSLESDENVDSHLQENEDGSQKERSKRINEESTSLCNISLDKKKFKSAKGSVKKSNRKKISST